MKSRIIILFIFVFLISLLITLNVIFHESLRNELAAQFNKQQVLIAKSISRNIKTAIDREAGKLRLLSRPFSEFSLKDKGVIKKLMEETFSSDDQIRVNTTVFNGAGDVLFTTLSYPPVPGNEGVKYFNKAKNLLDGEVEIYHDMTRVLLVTPLYMRDNFVGAIFLEVPIKDLAAMFLTPFKSKERGYAWLMDENGDLLYHPTEPAMIGNNLYSAKEECFKCHRSFELEKRVLEGPFVEYGRYIAPNKEDKVLAFSKVNIGHIQWLICVSSPYSEVISITERSMKLYSGLVVSIFVTVFLGASVMVIINRQRAKTEMESKEAILLEKQKLDTIVSAIGSGLMLLDKEHKILWINKTLREWAGDVEGKSCNVVYTDCSSGEISDDVTHETYKELFGKRGGTFQITSAPVRGKDGKIIAVLKLIQDVTEIKKLEESILRSEKLAALGRLAAGISHEIGNPLTSISSYVQILKEETDDNFTKESLETIHHHIIRISEIVGQMSRLSKLPRMELKKCDINNIIESSLEIVKYDKKLKNVKMVKDFTYNLPKVKVDENYLSQVFINLMLNAADAIDKEKGTIEIKSFRDNNSVIAQFVDSGKGIPAKNLDKIFDPFFTTKEKGTGLGLSISYEIVKRFGGELRVESHEDIGSTFSVILPVGDGQ